MTKTNWNPVAQSPMYYRHLALGAKMGVQDGWHQPVRYTSAREELEAVRRGVGIFDISPVGKLRSQGESLDQFLQASMANVTPTVRNRVAYHEFVDNDSAHRVVQARLTSDEMLLITAPSQAPTVLRMLRRASGADECAHIVDVTSGLAGLQIAGPQAYRLLQSFTDLDASPQAMPDMTCAQGMVAHIHGTLIRRDSVSMPSYEFYFGWEFGEYIFDTVLDLGTQYGLKPFGLEAASLVASDEGMQEVANQMARDYDDDCSEKEEDEGNLEE